MHVLVHKFPALTAERGMPGLSGFVQGSLLRQCFAPLWLAGAGFPQVMALGWYGLPGKLRQPLAEVN